MAIPSPSHSLHETAIELVQKADCAKKRRICFYPGWWDDGPLSYTMINVDCWSQLPKIYIAAINAAAIQEQSAV
jgi:TRAP-type mannitol/chloroaromatic compound transport system substrate-binding protein